MKRQFSSCGAEGEEWKEDLVDISFLKFGHGFVIGGSG